MNVKVMMMGWWWLWLPGPLSMSFTASQLLLIMLSAFLVFLDPPIHLYFYPSTYPHLLILSSTYPFIHSFFLPPYHPSINLSNPPYNPELQHCLLVEEILKFNLSSERWPNYILIIYFINISKFCNSYFLLK